MTLLVTTGKKPRTTFQRLKVAMIYYNPSLNEIQIKRSAESGWDTIGDTEDIYAFEVRSEDE